MKAPDYVCIKRFASAIQPSLFGHGRDAPFFVQYNDLQEL